MAIDFPDYAPTSTAAQQVVAGMGPGVGTVNFAFPYGTHAFLIYLNGLGTPPDLVLQPSGLHLVPVQFPGGGAQGHFFVAGPVTSAVDTSVDVTATAGVSTEVVAIMEAFYTAVMIVGGGIQTAAKSQSVVLASDSANLPTTLRGVTGSAFASLARAIGTYTFDVPNANGKGVEAYINASGGGVGTVTTTISDYNLGTGARAVLVSAAIASGGTVQMRVYPGIAAVANQAASDLPGVNPRFSCVVAGATLTFAVDYGIPA